MQFEGLRVLGVGVQGFRVLWVKIFEVLDFRVWGLGFLVLRILRFQISKLELGSYGYKCLRFVGSADFGRGLAFGI